MRGDDRGRSGIGAATAAAVAARGGRVVLTDVQAELLDRTAGELGDAVLDARPADVGDPSQLSELASAVHREHGTLDVVMNVAGVSAWGAVDRLRHEHRRRMIDVNLIGPINVIESFVPLMIEAGGGGHLVNVASAAALLGLPWHAAYLRAHDIGVTLVCPGAVATPLVDNRRMMAVARRAGG